jgi:3' terminal RNA ribose 2'-O-methyltransferase Hen1
MLLTITTTHTPATDLGYLLAKHPDRCQSFDLGFGQAHVFYPEASEERCTAALLLDVDPVGLVRGRRGPAGEAGALQQYVNDRPYVASSFLSVAIARVFGTALGGRSKERPALTETPLPLVAKLAAVPCRGGEPVLRQLFEPLGYSLSVGHHVLDETFPEWGESRYFSLELTGELRLRDLLAHLYVLIPVLDDDKHYWIGDDEVDKLLKHGAGWLAAHPARALIARRYLRHRARLMREALARLVEEEEPDPDSTEEAHAAEETAVEARISLGSQRVAAMLAAVKATGARRVLDLGCGEGRLLQALAEDNAFEAIAGMDVSFRALERARTRLERRPARQRERVTLFQGALTYRDARLAGYDAAIVMEVIEHLDPPRLSAFARALFGHTRPGAVILTTPNVEYNPRFESLPAGQLRHRDHRFEWTRAQFQSWASYTAAAHSYTIVFSAIGPEDPELGPPTQMAVFTRTEP